MLSRPAGKGAINVDDLSLGLLYRRLAAILWKEILLLLAEYFGHSARYMSESGHHPFSSKAYLRSTPNIAAGVLVHFNKATDNVLVAYLQSQSA